MKGTFKERPFVLGRSGGVAERGVGIHGARALR